MTNETIERALASLDAGSQDPETTEHLQPFLELVAELGRGIAKLSPSDRQSFIDATRARLRAAFQVLHNYLYETESVLTNEFYDDEWRRVCERRSRIEFLRTFFADQLESDALWLDTENLDSMLRDTGEREGHFDDAAIPPGTPPSHWWWWAPRTPPAS